MKKLIISTIIALPLFAQSSNFIEIGGGSQNITDNFHVESSLNNSSYNEADSVTKGIPYIQFQYTYENVIVKTIKENILFGYQKNNITAGLFTSISNGKETAWSNPYTLNANKDKTKVIKNGALIEYSIVQNANYGSKISYTYTKNDVENDTTISALQRDANEHEINIKNRYKNNILYSLAYNIYDAKGEESSSKSFKIGAGYIFNVNDTLNVTLLANVGKTSYDETNSILNEKIETTNTEFTAVGTWTNPFNLKDKYIKLIYKNSNENANHDFYDTKKHVAIVSMGFKF